MTDQERVAILNAKIANAYHDGQPNAVIAALQAEKFAILAKTDPSIAAALKGEVA